VGITAQGRASLYLLPHSTMPHRVEAMRLIKCCIPNQLVGDSHALAGLTAWLLGWYRLKE
jgi:hypothetical protein